MKKHPVDDLFKKRLTSLEKKPTELAWKRIQEGQKNKSRRMAAWVWYAAASMVLTMITGYLVWQSQDPVSSPTGTVQMARVEKVTPDVKPTPDPVTGKKEAVEGKDKELEIESAGQTPVLAEVKVDRKVHQKVIERNPLRKANAEENKPDNQPQIQIAKIETAKTNEVKLDKPDMQPSIVPEKVVPKAPELARVDEKKPDRTIIVEVEEPVNEPKEKGKPSRFARVFRQLKNVREAEPVDWDDVGFNPKSIMARADDRTNDDEKVSGKRERKN
ncbi:hypothetical protein [Dyadobacter sp. LHD-138]|uniref:hypothetical protein n=1 Tax=Dyadobacter sp. LHD-138 TaxID=3071413 RepID=UPI0027E0C22F|nr:hypothetical protein [Dyadobacter sp. LHD-138]MDQ6478840.1 hypothetical protein [Dyadobacter sp. LHD-138]